MSVCTFIASDHPLPAAAPSKSYPLSVNVDTGMIEDGGADDNFFLFDFSLAEHYSGRKYGVSLEWRYTPGRADRIITYLKEALRYTDSLELWRVWLGDDYYEYEESPVIHNCTVPVSELTIEDIREIDEAQIWNTPDKAHPQRPSFYRLTITS